MRLSHLTVLTRDLDAALAAWSTASALTASVEETDEARVARLSVGDAAVELVEPAAGSSAASLIQERGEGMFSVTVEVEDLEATVRDLRAKDVVVTAVETGADGARTAMIDPRSTHGLPINLKERAR